MPPYMSSRHCQMLGRLGFIRHGCSRFTIYLLHILAYWLPGMPQSSWAEPPAQPHSRLHYHYTHCSLGISFHCQDHHAGLLAWVNEGWFWLHTYNTLGTQILGNACSCVPALFAPPCHHRRSGWIQECSWDPSRHCHWEGHRLVTWRVIHAQ